MNAGIWDRLTKGSSKLVADTAKSAPGEKATEHVWCSAVVVGSDKCPCPKHQGKPKEEDKNES